MERSRPLEEVVLPYSSQLYKTHARQIADLCDTVKELDLVTDDQLLEVASPQGLVCHRKEGDTGESIGHLFTQIAAVNTQQYHYCLEPAEEVLEVRELLYQVLALHLGIQDQLHGSPRSDVRSVSQYYERIVDIDVFCRDTGLPLILPYLFKEGTLMKRLEHEGYGLGSEVGARNVTGFFRKLSSMFFTQPKFRGVVKASGSPPPSQATPEKASSLAVERHSVGRNDEPSVGETHQLLMRNAYGEVARRCKRLGDVIFDSPNWLAMYIRALHGEKSFVELCAVMNRGCSQGSAELLDAKRAACVDIGEWFFTRQKFHDGMNFIESQGAYVLADPSVEAVYLKLAEAIDPSVVNGALKDIAGAKKAMSREEE